MTVSDIRSDPYAWAFVRQHHQVRPRIVRARRIRRGFEMSIGGLATVALLMFGVSLFGSGAGAATAAVEGSGGVEITIRPDAASQQIVGEVRSLFDDRGIDVRVETITGRDAVVGRLLGDGAGVFMIDSDPALDYTATRVLVEPDASGVISILVHTENGRWDLQSGELACSTFGRSLAEVRAELEASGYTVAVTSVALDAANESGAYGVVDADLSGNHVTLIAQPVVELPDSTPFCR